MKKICFYLCLILTVSFVYSQNQADSKASLTGFDGLQWGVSYKDAKERFRTLSSSSETKEPVSIIADSPESELKIQRNKIVYRYLFYQKPEILAGNEKKSDSGADTPSETGQNDKVTQTENKFPSRLFLVESIFPYVPAQELYDKISAKYGARNGGNLDEKTNRGYYLWSLDKGYLIQWIDPYKKNPFSRSIYYLSKEIVEEIRVDFPKFQYSKELKILKDVLY